MDDNTRSMPEQDPPDEAGNNSGADDGKLTARHLSLGWHSLLLFLALGIVLEGLHAFKLGWYLDVGNEARRLMLRLAHAHGTLLSLVNIAFAWTATTISAQSEDRLSVPSLALVAATILLPGGFFLGGLFIYSGDPGFGVWLVPIGALMLLLAVFLTARAVVRP